MLSNPCLSVTLLKKGFFVGLCAEFPGLSWLAVTAEETLSGIRQLVVQVVVDLHAING